MVNPGIVAGFCLAAGLSICACAATPPPELPTTGTPVAPRPVSFVFHDAAAETLAADLRRSVSLLPGNTAATRAAMTAADAMLQRSTTVIARRQAVLVVDRSPHVQRLWVAIAYPDGRPLDALGAVSVSTGKPGRKEHFRTPVGVFVNDGSVLGYRAQGTYNENHIRGNGLKGMRVWDFGWQTTDDWRTPGALMGVRMEMHATDPANLEHRLGRWDSEGCIRIPASFDAFLDRSELIDADLRDAARTQRRFAALLLKDATTSPLAGNLLVVIDSSEPGAVPSDPVRANAMEQPRAAEPGASG